MHVRKKYILGAKCPLYNGGKIAGGKIDAQNILGAKLMVAKLLGAKLTYPPKQATYLVYLTSEFSEFSLQPLVLWLKLQIFFSKLWETGVKNLSTSDNYPLMLYKLCNLQTF